MTKGRTKNDIRSEIEIRTLQKGGEWHVEFNYNNQFFAMPTFSETQEEADWHAKMLRLCFNTFMDDLLEGIAVQLSTAKGEGGKRLNTFKEGHRSGHNSGIELARTIVLSYKSNSTGS